MKHARAITGAAAGALGVLAAGCAARSGAPATAPTMRMADIAGDHFRVEASAPADSCERGQPCTLRLRLRAVDGYHVNESYPFGFVGESSPAVTYADRGAFVHEGASEGTLTVRFTPQTSGATILNGVFRLCVCSDERCQIDAATVALAITAR